MRSVQEKDKKPLLALARSQAKRETDRAFIGGLLADVRQAISGYQKVRKYSPKQKMIPKNEGFLFQTLLDLRRKLEERVKLKGG